ncbi:IS3 family transposase, partial [Saccharothrix sp. NRRL B-16348]|uniref:IS3 family transposase n=1 Tax=Saccharothrix sp. NRRL B-16348 TaxID=1415542 RepID=UPI000AF18F1A
HCYDPCAPCPPTPHRPLDNYRSVNAVAESFFATIKTELLDRQPWPTRTRAHKAIFEYIEGWFNTRRLHSSLGYLSPAAYETTRHHPVDRVA